MHRIVVWLLTASLFFIQQNYLYAEADDETPPTTLPDVPNDDDPVGEPGPVEESNSGSGGSGALLAIGAVAVVWAISNSRSKLEKTFVADAITGSTMTQISGVNKRNLQWSLHYGTLSHDSLYGALYGVNQQEKQQIFSWSVGHALTSAWKINNHFGFAYSTDLQGETDYRQWLSVGLNRQGLFMPNDRLDFSLGKRYSQDINNDNYFSNTSNSSLFDLQKNALGNGDYINLSYLRPINNQSSMTWQWQYNAKQSQSLQSDNFSTVTWRYRY